MDSFTGGGMSAGCATLLLSTCTTYVPQLYGPPPLSDFEAVYVVVG